MDRNQACNGSVMRLARSLGFVERSSSMADFIVAVLGTGGILLMAAYAALCERI